MVSYELRLNRGRLLEVGRREARRRVARVVRRTENRSAALAPVDTGYMRASRKSSIVDRGFEVVGTVAYTASYAAAVHNGRRALTIRPKRPGGRLKFQVGGKTVYTRQVHQPARAGRPFLATALREVAAGEGFTYRAGTRVRG